MALPVIAGIGLGLQAFSSIKQGLDRAAISDMDAQLKNAQADQIMKVNDRQQYLYKFQGQQLAGEQKQAYAEGGVELEGSPMLAMIQTQHQLELQSMASQQSSEFNAAALRKGGEISKMYGGDYASAGFLNAGSTILTGAARAYSLKDSNQGGTSPFTSRSI